MESRNVSQKPSMGMYHYGFMIAQDTRLDFPARVDSKWRWLIRVLGVAICEVYNPNIRNLRNDISLLSRYPPRGYGRMVLDPSFELQVTLLGNGVYFSHSESTI